LIVHEPIFVPINGSAEERGDGAGEIASAVVSSGPGMSSWCSVTGLSYQN
jgi:hypothetical protein